MKVSYLISGIVAILVGAIFTAVTLFFALEDVIRHGAEFSIRHAMIICVIVGAIYFGHQVWQLAKEWRIFSAAACALLFATGTLYGVISSAGRSIESLTYKTQVAKQGNVGRDIVKRDMDEAKAAWDKKVKEAAAQCATGEGPYCKAAQFNVLVAKATYDSAKIEYSKLPPEKTANGDVRGIAKLLSEMSTWNIDKIESILLLLIPCIQAVFTEVGAIVGFTVGLTNLGKVRVAPVPASASVPSVPALPAPTIAGLLSAPKAPENEESSPATWKATVKVQRPARPTDQQLVLKALWDGDKPLRLTNEQLAEALKCSGGEATKRRQICEDAGIVAVEREGRFLMIRPLVPVDA